jgi:hypothetical protein
MGRVPATMLQPAEPIASKRMVTQGFDHYLQLTFDSVPHISSFASLASADFCSSASLAAGFPHPKNILVKPEIAAAAPVSSFGTGFSSSTDNKIEKIIHLQHA